MLDLIDANEATWREDNGGRFRRTLGAALQIPKFGVEQVKRFWYGKTSASKDLRPDGMSSRAFSVPGTSL